MALEFRKAERRRARLRLAWTGPSGSGKTYSALLVAKGMGGKIACVDTENSSMELYAGFSGMPEFEVLDLEPPYITEKYIRAIELAVKSGFEILIIDSISHAWAGEGGLLQQKEEIDARGGKGEKNKYANWATITKKHEQFRAWLLKIPIHLMVTMRSKTDYVLGEGNAPIKVGMAPIQRDGMEYEFTTVFDLALNHSAKASKDRTGMFDQKIFVPTEDTGRQLVSWLNSGTEPVATQHKEGPPMSQSHSPGGSSSPKDPRELSQKQIDRLHAIRSKAGWEISDVKEYVWQLWAKTSSKELTWVEYEMLCKHMEANPKKKEAPATTNDFAPPASEDDLPPREPGEEG